jgi:hypothetical protein
MVNSEPAVIALLTVWFGGAILLAAGGALARQYRFLLWVALIWLAGFGWFIGDLVVETVHWASGGTVF